MINDIIAKSIITSIESGAVPLSYSDYYNVGRISQVETVKNEILNGKTKLRFINGDYGSGKTHFLSTIRNWGIKKNFTPSHVVLSPRGTPLNNLKYVYSRIIKNISIENNEHQSPIEAVLEFVYQNFQIWLKGYMDDGGQRCEKTLINRLYCKHCNENGLIEKLYIRNFEKLDRRLQIAIMIYRRARWGANPDFETADLVIRWLEGEPLYRKDLNYIGMWDRIDQDDMLRGISEISKLVSLLNKRGVLIMLDEAEGIEKLTIDQRPNAYKNLQFLIEGAKKHDNIYFLYATTPTFYADVKNYSNELARIVSSSACTDLAPLSIGEKKDLCKRILEIYKAANFIEINDLSSKEMIKEHLEKFGIATSVREFITGFTNRLSRLY